MHRAWIEKKHNKFVASHSFRSNQVKIRIKWFPFSATTTHRRQVALRWHNKRKINEKQKKSILQVFPWITVCIRNVYSNFLLQHTHIHIHRLLSRLRWLWHQPTEYANRNEWNAQSVYLYLMCATVSPNFTMRIPSFHMDFTRINMILQFLISCHQAGEETRSREKLLSTAC